MAEIFAQLDAMERVDNDTELYFELIDMLLESYKADLDKIDQAISDNNMVTLNESAHSIKSALGNLGAMTCFEMAAELERMGKNNEARDAKDKLADLRNEIEKFNSAVATFRATV